MRRKDEKSDQRRIAEIGLIGVLGAALISGLAVVVTSIVQSSDDGGDPSPNTTTSPTAISSVEKVQADAQTGRVVMMGRADKTVHTVVALAGPKPGATTYWASVGDIRSDGTWEAVVDIAPPPIPDSVIYQAVFESAQSSDPVPFSCYEIEGPACNEGVATVLVAPTPR